MPRDVDARKKRKALRKLRKAAELAEAGLGPPLTDWERAFLEEVEARIEEFGSAFADPSKGDLDEPLSALQAHKLKEIDKKARGKARGGLPRRRSASAPDQTEEPEESPAAPPPPSGPPKLRVIEGGGCATDPDAPPGRMNTKTP